MGIRRPRYADIASTLALVIALSTGGAYAAHKIHTSDIANNAVTSHKIKKNAVNTNKIKNGQIGFKDLGNGVRNDIVPPWGTIPSEQTVKGYFFDTGSSSTQLTSQVENVSLPAAAPAAITEDDVSFGGVSLGGAALDSGCTGTFEEPTAPVGWVCVYLDGLTNLKLPHVAPWGVSVPDHYGFSVQFRTSTADQDWDYWGSWAYTAP